MLLNSSFTYLELRWVNLYETIRRLYYAQDDRQSSQSNPAFYTPAYYPLSRTFLPHFLSRLLPVVTPASRTPALPLFTHSRILARSKRLHYREQRTLFMQPVRPTAEKKSDK